MGSQFIHILLGGIDLKLFICTCLWDCNLVLCRWKSIIRALSQDLSVHLAIGDLREAAMWPASRHCQPRGFAGSNTKYKPFGYNYLLQHILGVRTKAVINQRTRCPFPQPSRVPTDEPINSASCHTHTINNN